jgi:putative peptidoglycan lipid II flippase
VAIGAILHFVAQMISVRRIGFVFIFENLFSFWRDTAVRKVIALMIPRTLTVAANQINLFVITIFASTLTAGSLAVFNFANNLQSIPLALFGISFATAVFPRLSTLSAKKDHNGFSHTFYRTLKRILFFVVPITALILVLRAQIVRVVLGAGNFDWEDTELTLGVLGILALSLFAQSLIPLLARSFYSLQNTKTPFFITVFSEGINIVLAVFLIEEFAIYGLAIAFTVSAIIQMCLMLFFLRRWVVCPGKEVLMPFIFKLFIASLVAGVVAQGMKSFWGIVTNLDTFWEVFVQLVFSGGAGVLVFILMAIHLHIDEYEDLKKNVMKRIFGKEC